MLPWGKPGEGVTGLSFIIFCNHLQLFESRKSLKIGQNFLRNKVLGEATDPFYVNEYFKNLPGFNKTVNPKLYIVKLLK